MRPRKETCECARNTVSLVVKKNGDVNVKHQKKWGMKDEGDTVGPIREGGGADAGTGGVGIRHIKRWK